jgi:hypothetical protein
MRKVRLSYPSTGLNRLLGLRQVEFCKKYSIHTDRNEVLLVVCLHAVIVWILVLSLFFMRKLFSPKVVTVNTHRQAHRQTDTHIYTHRLTHTDTHMDTHAYTHKHTHRHIHTDTHTHTHKHTDIHSHTDTQTHT